VCVVGCRCIDACQFDVCLGIEREKLCKIQNLSASVGADAALVIEGKTPRGVVMRGSVLVAGLVIRRYHYILV
jgi:hypothetical protein